MEILLAERVNERKELLSQSLEWQRKYEAAHKDAAESRSRLEELERELGSQERDARLQNESHAQQAQDVQAEVLVLNSDLDLAVKKQKHLEMESEQLRASCAVETKVLLQRLQQLGEEKDAAVAQRNQLRTKLREMEEVREAVDPRVGVMELTITALQNTIEDLTQQLCELGRGSGAEHSNLEPKEEAAPVHDDSNQLCQSLSRMAREVSTLKKELADKNALLEATLSKLDAQPQPGIEKHALDAFRATMGQRVGVALSEYKELASSLSGLFEAHQADSDPTQHEQGWANAASKCQGLGTKLCKLKSLVSKMDDGTALQPEPPSRPHTHSPRRAVLDPTEVSVLQSKLHELQLKYDELESQKGELESVAPTQQQEVEASDAYQLLLAENEALRKSLELSESNASQRLNSSRTEPEAKIFEWLTILLFISRLACSMMVPIVCTILC